ncbi:MAG: hypothetical protein ABW156_02915 [Jiangellaceae bacterium]
MAQTADLAGGIVGGERGPVLRVGDSAEAIGERRSGQFLAFLNPEVIEEGIQRATRAQHSDREIRTIGEAAGIAVMLDALSDAATTIPYTAVRAGTVTSKTPNGLQPSLEPTPAQTSSLTTDEHAATSPPEQALAHGPATRIARLITEVFSPGILVAALLLLVAWHASATVLEAILWGLIAAGAASFLPLLYIFRGVRRGQWTDKHVTQHSQRRLPLLIILLSTAAGTLALVIAGAPQELLALIASMVAALLVAVPITVITHWGISIHALVAAGAVAALMVVFGPVMAAGWLIAAAVAWARVQLAEHTVGQVLAGAAVGTAATGALFPLLF